MISTHDPKWLQFLSRHLKWLAIPNLATVFIVLQILGFIALSSDPAWAFRLALIPELVLKGEIWRVVTFLALPLSGSLIWQAVALWFEYFILNSIEAEWGAFKTTFYILISIVLTVAFSLIFNYPVTRVSDFTSTLFLAAAALFPNFEIQMYFFIPVKIKYLGWLALAWLTVRFIGGDWIDRIYLITIYSNYLLFFGPSLLYSMKQWKRRRDFRAKWR